MSTLGLITLYLCMVYDCLQSYLSCKLWVTVFKSYFRYLWLSLLSTLPLVNRSFPSYTNKLPKSQSLSIPELLIKKLSHFTSLCTMWNMFRWHKPCKKWKLKRVSLQWKSYKLHAVIKTMFKNHSPPPQEAKISDFLYYWVIIQSQCWQDIKNILPILW